MFKGKWLMLEDGAIEGRRSKVEIRKMKAVDFGRIGPT
jgi:hypothetical protein